MLLSQPMKLASLAFAALVACAAPAALGQEPAAPDAAPAAREQPGLKIRGLSFLADAPTTDVFAHDPAAKPGTPGVKFDIKNYLNHEFAMIPVGAENLIFTKSGDAASTKDPASVLAKVKLPQHFRKGILVFLPGSAKPGEPIYRVLPIDDAVKVFPRGSVNVINLSPVPVKIVLEKQEYVYKSGEAKVIENQPVDASNASAMTAYAFKDNQWQRFGQTVWPHPGEKRVIQIIFENPKSKNVELVGIRDIAVRDN